MLKLSAKKAIILLTVLITSSTTFAQNFITREGTELKDGKKTFRFAGVQAPELHRIEDDARGVCKEDKRGWGQYFKWPTADEQENYFQALSQTGHKVMRTYVLSIAHEDDAACGRETHIMAPATPGGMPVMNEEAMVHYDRMIALAEKYNVRLILPFIDYWPWWGGREQLAAFYNEKGDDLYDIKSKTYAAYQNIIYQVINRKNTITGRLYKDEKSIMCWESGNEMQFSNQSFLNATSAYVKSLDKNHLFMDGNYARLNDYSLEDPNVDIISNHYYENVGNLKPETILADLKHINGKKVYIIGEFGLLKVDKLQGIMDAAVTTEYNGAKTAGVFVWGMRGHRHNGGFYWHKEGATDVYSYHIPGFPEGDFNQETQVIDMVRTAIAQMDGKKTMQPLPKPFAPKLREIATQGKINWMGAAVGRSYRIERAECEKGKWKTIGDNISDGKHKYNPETDDLFADKDVLEKGKTYYYRVIAKNETGESKPSNVVSLTIK